MNKKLAVLLVVPLLVSLGGAFAFSAFSGSSSVTINNTAGHLTWENQATLTATNANNTPLTMQGPNGNIYEIGTGMEHFHASGMYNLGFGAQYYTTATSGREYVINVTNFAPGEFIQLTDVITNNGTVGFIVTAPYAQMNFNTSDPPLPPPPPPHPPISNPSGQTSNKINATSVPSAYFMDDLQSSTGWIYNVTEVSGFGISLSPEGSATMIIMIGLGNSNGHDVNYYQDSSFSLNIDLNVISDP